jgi:Na+:H+ antiporter, NhaA family
MKTPLRSRSRSFPGFQVIAPLRDFLRTSAAGGLLVVLAAAIALVWANSPWRAGYARLWASSVSVSAGSWTLDLDLRHWVNDALMTLFFFVVGLEIKRELVEGELNSLRKASLPVMAAIGGMTIPAVIYVAFNSGNVGSRGWGIPMATDIAMALGVLALLGDRVPGALKLLLLAIAIVDDIGAIAVIALFYAESLRLRWLLAAALLLVVVVTMKWLNIQYVSCYLFVGALLWYVVFRSGVHPTIAGVLLGLAAPTKPSISPDLIDENVLADVSDLASVEQTVRMARGSVSVIERLEHQLYPWTSLVIVPLFAVANAGISLNASALESAFTSRISLGIICALVIGKVVGIVGASWLAVRTAVSELPDGVTWPMVVGVGSLGGIGFTVSLFVANLAFASELQRSEAKVGIFAASIVSAALGIILVSRSIRPAEHQ